MSYLDLDLSLVQKFKDLLDSPPAKGQKEQEIQEFMEEHSELIPTNAMGLLHHGLNFKSVISKLPLGTTEIPDWVVLSKRSDRWLCTIIELKQPKAKFFGGAGSSTTSREFELALEQLRGNRRFVNANEQAVRQTLDPLIQPPNFKSVPMHFEHVLIYGRSAEKNLGKERIEIILDREKETDFRILTYDSVIDAYKNGPRFRKNILRPSAKGYAFKRMVDPARIFCFIRPTELHLSSEEVENLRANGYQIDAWREEGRLLDGIEGKTVRTSIEDDVDEMIKDFYDGIGRGERGSPA